MTEEAKQTETKAVETSEKKLPDGSISFDKGDDAESKENSNSIGGLFSDEAPPSLDELSGVKSEEKAEEKAEESKKEEKAVEKKTEEKALPEGDKKEEKAEESKEEKAEESKKIEVPPGYVPTSALLEERKARRELRTEVVSLKQEVANLKKAASKSSEKASEVDEEKGEDRVTSFERKLENLIKEDEDAADPDPLETQTKMLKLLKELPSILKSAKQKPGKKDAESPKVEEEDDLVVKDIVAGGLELMEELVPGITDTEGNEINQKLTLFARENGIPRGLLPLITNPGTVILGAKGEPKHMGDDAAYLVLFLKKMYDRIASPTVTEEMEKQILSKNESKWKEEITKAVTTEVLAKVGKKGSDFKSIMDLPGESKQEDDSIFAGKRLSESEYFGMSAKEKEKYLMS